MHLARRLISTIVTLKRVKEQLIVERHSHHWRKNRVKEQQLRQNELGIAEDLLPVHSAQLSGCVTPGARVEGVSEVLPNGCKELTEQSD